MTLVGHKEGVSGITWLDQGPMLIKLFVERKICCNKLVRLTL